MKSISTLLLLLISTIGICQIAPIKVLVTDFQNKPLQCEKVQFEDQVTKKIISGVSEKDGYFKVDLPGGVTYNIKIKSVGEAQDYNTFEIPAIGENEMYGENQMQIMIEQPKMFTLENVLFESGKSSIKSSSYSELDELVSLLNNKKEMNIEIAGHTDNVGNPESNKKLSVERAKAVQTYVIKKGIDASRVKATGYGDSQPVADNNTSAGKKLNRRTEVRVLN